ncbi:MAG: RlmE family RNA methyltransferase [Pseudomonadota bacterium]
MAYDRKDHYYRKAKEEGKASRAAYKLVEFQRRFSLIKRGQKIVDLGCAPGGWLIELSQMVGESGKVVGVDLLPLKIELPPNVKFIQGSMEDDAIIERLKVEAGGDIDLVVSDMAPNTSGVAFKDAYLSYELCVVAFEVAQILLKIKGSFIAKIFSGQEVLEFRKLLQSKFEKVVQVVPPATRKHSKELYLLGLNYRG